MTLADATVTFNLKDQLGDQFDARRTKIWVSTNVPDETIIDTDSGTIRLGSGNVLIDELGNVSVTVWVPGADSNPASWQTYIHVDYPDKNAPTGRNTRDFGPFTITASAALADLVQQQEIPPTYLSEVAGALQGFVDDAEAAATAAQAVGTTNDTIIAGRLNDDASAATAAANARYLRITEAPQVVRASGVDDTSAIQAMLDMPGVLAGRAAVTLLPGVEYLTSPLLLKSHQSIESLTTDGFGTDTSVKDRTAIIKLLPNSSGPLIKDYNSTVGSASLRRVTLDGNKANQSASNAVIEMTAAASGTDPRWSLEQVFIRNGKGGGIKQGANRRGLQLADVQVWQCDGDGITLNASDNILDRVSVGQSTGAGIKITAGLQRIFGGDVFSNQVGLDIADTAAGCEIVGVSMDRNLRQGAIVNGPRNSLIGCIFDCNSQSTNNAYSHVDFGYPAQTALYSSLIAPTFNHSDVSLTNKPQYGIYANVQVYVVAPMWNPAAVPWATAYTPGDHLLLASTQRLANFPVGVRLGAATTSALILPNRTSTPEGSETAPQGSWVTAVVSGTATPYFKQTGTGNTGWVAK